MLYVLLILVDDAIELQAFVDSAFWRSKACHFSCTLWTGARMSVTLEASTLGWELP
jgi:hypothetical protein